MIKNYQPNGTGLVSYGFSILDNVAQPGYTKWSIVYDQTNLRVYFRTSTEREIKYADLQKFDFSCSTRVRVLDINFSHPGNVDNFFRSYTTQANRNLIQQSYHNTPNLTSASNAELEPLVLHPETFTCE
ncbi:MAG: hypothetical protein C5B54_09250 [Acidobacteria bacterium]|nr:MAG: hypothetical protein C5B54_09250 [Acidobacteriota bacterium]